MEIIFGRGFGGEWVIMVLGWFVVAEILDEVKDWVYRRDLVVLGEGESIQG